MSQPIETHLLGDLTPDELLKLKNLRAQSEQLIYQIGMNRVTEQRMFSQLQGLERMTQAQLNQVGSRLGVPDGTLWQVTADGKAVLTSSHPED